MEMEIISIFFHKHFPCNTPCNLCKNPQIKPRKSLCTRQDLGCPPMCGQGQGFATKRETFGERGIILHTRQVETSSRALKILAMESISHL